MENIEKTDKVHHVIRTEFGLQSIAFEEAQHALLSNMNGENSMSLADYANEIEWQVHPDQCERVAQLYRETVKSIIESGIREFSASEKMSPNSSVYFELE